jgi:hypothetical protein
MSVDESTTPLVYGQRDISHTLKNVKQEELKLIKELVEYATLNIPTRQFRMSKSVYMG